MKRQAVCFTCGHARELHCGSDCSASCSVERCRCMMYVDSVYQGRPDWTPEELTLP